VNVFVYEHLTGGGCFSGSPPTVPSGSLLAEGRAMVEAVAIDFARAGCEIVTQWDARLQSCGIDLDQVSPVMVDSATAEKSAFERLAAEADWTIAIAPEIDDSLFRRVQLVEDVGGRLLGPGLEAVRRASDKWQTYQALVVNGVQTPDTWLIGDNGDLKIEAHDRVVLKPRWGAGSVGVRLYGPKIPRPSSGGLVGQPFCEGTPASVAFLLGPGICQPLTPCRQRLSRDGRFQYGGGCMPLAPALQLRAAELGQAAIDAVIGAARGYVGIDLILGDNADGSDDYVIEVNPRLTTSYVGLRKACMINLARAMIDVANGKPATLRFDDKPLQFDTNGKVWWVEDDVRNGLLGD